MATLAFLAGAAWEVYGRALPAPFLFDDTSNITDNLSIVRLWPLVGDSQHRGPLNPPPERPTSGRPLVNLSLALNYHFGRLNPAGYHLFNLFVHVLSAMLLMAIVHRTLRLDYFAGRFDAASGPLAFVVALLWLLHPLQTETVVYITQRTELMVGFFYLATLYTSLRYWETASPAGRTAWLVLATLACLAGTACKEVMVTAPVVVLLFERTFFTGSFRRALQKSWPLYVGLALGWALLLALNYSAPRSISAGFNRGVPADVWWLTQSKVLWMYLKLAVWPWPLSIHYDIAYLPTIDAALPWLVPSLLLVIGTLILVVRRSAIGFVGAWVLLILSPTLIVPIITEVAAERRMYLPLAALVALFVAGGYWLAKQLAPRRAQADASPPAGRWPGLFAGAAALALAVVLSFVSVRRLEAYNDLVTLWQDALASQPNDWVSHCNLGSALVDKGNLEKAKEHFREALRLKPALAEAHYNLGFALSKEGQTNEAIDEYQQAVQLDSNYADAQRALAVAFNNAGRSQEAIEHYRQVARLRPDYPESAYALAVALKKSGQLPEALEYYRKTVDLSPDRPELLDTLAAALIDAQRPQEAIECLVKSLQLKPRSAEAHNNLGVALANSGKLPEAIEQYQEALKLKLDYADAHHNLANALLKSHRPQEAVAQFEEALRLKPDNAEIQNSLGNALLSAGRSNEAIEHFHEALRLKPEYAEAEYNLGNALASANQLPEALAHFEAALRFKPEFAEAANNAGSVLLNTGRLQEAIQQYQHAVKLKPDYAEAHFNLANALNSNDRPQEALEHYLQAVHLQPGYTPAWFNLASTYAQLKQAQEAVAAAKKALELARSQGQAALAQQIETWLSQHHAEQSTGPGAPRTKNTPATP